MLKKFDTEDLDRLWSLVKKTFSSTDPTEDKEKELWVKLKRLYEPDPRDQLWALQRYMHDPLQWRLYDTCGVHHVSTGRGHKIFMLVEKDYPLTKGLTTLLLCNKLQVDQVSCYTDAGYLTDVDDLKSQTGYVFISNGGAVDWKSAKQSIFATSSAEAEYIAAYDASKEAIWVRKFIYGLGVVPIIEEPVSMYCNNTGAITIANESGITKGARHFRAKVHYLHEVIKFGDIKLEKVHTDDNLADPFTKALAFPKHSEHTKNIRMLPASSLM
ncbi:hypothetical protein Tco_0412918 [Tanacetum coccineum]